MVTQKEPHVIECRDRFLGPIYICINYSTQEKTKGKRVNPPYMTYSQGIPSQAIIRDGTRFSVG